MKYKIYLTLLIIFTISIRTFSQENINAMLEYKIAEKAYHFSNFKKCIIHLNKSIEILKRKTPKTLFLLTKSYYNLYEYDSTKKYSLEYISIANNTKCSEYEEMLDLSIDIDEIIKDFSRETKSFKKLSNSSSYTEYLNFNKTYPKNKYKDQIDIIISDKIFLLGDKALKNNDYIDARYYYNKYLDIYTKDSNKKTEAYYKIGLSYFKQEKYDDATFFFENSLKSGNRNTYYTNAEQKLQDIYIINNHKYVNKLLAKADVYTARALQRKKAIPALWIGIPSITYGGMSIGLKLLNKSAGASVLTDKDINALDIVAVSVGIILTMIGDKAQKDFYRLTLKSNKLRELAQDIKVEK